MAVIVIGGGERRSFLGRKERGSGGFVMVANIAMEVAEARG